jgi:GT2 family glycosyltransferase
MSIHLDCGHETLMDIFHRHRQSNEAALAAVALERALQTSKYRPEAMIWKGIDVLAKNPKLAFLFFSNAAYFLPERAEVNALVARSLLLQDKPASASQYLASVWQKKPKDATIRMALWQSRSASETAKSLRRIIFAHLPDITSGSELAYVLKQLATQTESIGVVGVVRYYPLQKEIRGWAVDLTDVNQPPALQIEANGQVHFAKADRPHPLLKAAGLPQSHGGILIKVPNPTSTVHLRTANGMSLLGSPVSAMPSFTQPKPVTPKFGDHPADVLIPVYDGLDETLECIDSVIAARKQNRTPHRLIILEDASPIPQLRKALKVLANKGKITLVEHPVNLGFIRSMNRGMALNTSHDVVWLNADTRVHGDWLDRLRAAAYLSEDIASVTPFTNNGELMSFPVSRMSSPMPSPAQQARLDYLARNSGNDAVELETGCGFCLYIKRSALDAVGYLDELELSRGYGEETDWCLRARHLGWRHMGATNVFVAHKGGVSFGEEKLLRVAYNNAVLRNRFPAAEADYDRFCQRDPLHHARNALQRGRIEEISDWLKSASANDNTNQLCTIHVQPESDTDHVLSLRYHQEINGPVVTLKAAIPPFDVIIEYPMTGEQSQLIRDLQTIGAASHGRLSACTTTNSHPSLFLRALENAGIELELIDDTVCETNIVLEGLPSGLSLVMIADDLSIPEVSALWVAYAQHCCKNAAHPALVYVDDNGLQNALQATGIAYPLLPLSALDQRERLNCAGVQHLVTLSNKGHQSRHARRMAQAYALPLHSLSHIISNETASIHMHSERTRTRPGAR